ncbi:uncharacterized protein LOC131658629 [Vicia villosa]|uniref:uncharacterized protein LOC131658629 n=1 Tax=Vicia villosa TaxID=3911 RepID=UPI00273AFFC8|nr:uncharacterized protein LOC131658629 [Vicia villosa]
MARMHFPVVWVNWIHEYVSTAMTSILVNESPTDEFRLERGLRLGDPLLQFLFVLVVEGLDVFMKSLVQQGLYFECKVGNGEGEPFTHLQFPYDTLLMGSKSWSNVRSLKAVWLLFESIPGLKVNFHKRMLVGVNISNS